MSASPRRKTFPTLHTAMECTTSPPTAAVPVSSTQPNNSIQQRESQNASPPTVPYTMNDMNTGINHIITEAMVREQLNGAAAAATPPVIAPPTDESPSKRLLKGLTTTCDGSYGQQLLAPSDIMDSVPVEDVRRWKDWRRKQKTAANATEIDVDGFPYSEEISTTDDSNDGDNVPKQSLSLATSTSNSEVGTEIASNTAQYLMKQSNIKARQLMSSSEENEEDDTDDWGPPLDVRDDWASPLNADESQDDCVANNSADSNVVVHEESKPMPSEIQEPLPNADEVIPTEVVAESSMSKREVPTMDEVHNFMNQLKQKSAVGRERDSKYAKSSENNNTSESSSSKPLSQPPAQSANEKSDSKIPSTPSSTDVQKSLMEHRERMRQQKLEGQRKRQEFDARLQLLRSQLHEEAVDVKLQLLRSKIHDDAGLIITSAGGDSNAANHIVEQGEKNVSENTNAQKQFLPGARWSGGLAVWSPSSGGADGGNGGSSAILSSRPGGSSSKQPQQQQSTPRQLLPPTGIGIDEDDFSFSPVDIDAVLGERSDSKLNPKELEQSSSERLELFSEAYGASADNEAKPSIAISSLANKDSAQPSAAESKVIDTYYPRGESRASNLPTKSPPSDASPPVSNGSSNITEGDKGGGLGSGYVGGFGDKSMASSVNVELGFGLRADPPLNDEDLSEKEEGNLLGVTVVGSKKHKRKSNSTCKYGAKEDGTMVEDGEDGNRRDPSPVTLEPTTKDAPFERKQVDPDGIVWKDIDIVKLTSHSTEPTTPSSSVRKGIDADLEEIDSYQSQSCPDNIFSPKNNNRPPATPRITPHARDGQLNPGDHVTPRSKLLPTPRATPRTVRAANLSSRKSKFGFAVEDDSPDTSIKINEKPIAALGLEVHIPTSDAEQMNVKYGTPRSSSEQIDVQKNEGRTPENFKNITMADLQSKFASNTFGIDHLHKSLQNIREQKAIATPKSQFKAHPLDSPVKDSNTPSRIYLDGGELRAMSSLETDTYVSTVDFSLHKGVSDDNDATIGDSTLGAGSMDTKKALRYAKRLENLNVSEDNSKENHEDEDTTSIVALRRKAYENQGNNSIREYPNYQDKVETVGSQNDKRSLASHRSLPNASNRYEQSPREEARHVHKKPSQDYSSVSQSSPGGKSSVVASIKDRIAAYDGQNSNNGKPSPYRLSSQSKTFQVRVGGQVKSINIQNTARRQDIKNRDSSSSQNTNNAIGETSVYTAGAAVTKEKILPAREMNQNKQHPSPAAASNGTPNDGQYPPKNEPSIHQSQATGRQHHSETSHITPIDTTYEYPALDDEEDGITLSPTISEVSGLTLATCLASEPVVNECERTMTPIARLRHKKQVNKFAYEHTDAPTPRTSVGTNKSSRRDQIVSRIRETSSNGNLWQKRNVVTEVSYSTSGDASGKSKSAVGYPYSRSAPQGKVAEKVAKINGPREDVNLRVADRVARMNRQSKQHKARHRGSMSDEPSSSLATRDCIRVD